MICTNWPLAGSRVGLDAFLLGGTKAESIEGMEGTSDRILPDLDI